MLDLIKNEPIDQGMMVLDMKSWTRCTIVLLVSFGTLFTANAKTQTNTEMWQALDSNAKSHTQLQAKSRTYNNPIQGSRNSYQKAQYLSLNTGMMRTKLGLDANGLRQQKLQAKPAQGNTTNSENLYQISVPLPDGSIIELSLVEDSVLPAKLAAKYPDINTYRVLGDDRVFSGKVDMSSSGFHAMLKMLDGETLFIDPVALATSEYAVFSKKNQRTTKDRQHSCGVEDSSDFSMSNLLASKSSEAQTDGIAARTQESLINYTIAIATTGEYSAKFGGSVGGTLSAITTTINRVNQVLESDLGIHLNLVEDNDLLINTNAVTDYFTKSKLLDLVHQNQEYIDSVIDNASYDIGHLFTTSGGGLAAIASACNNNNKAKGASGTTSPRGDSFDLDFVAHEIGHQLGATHTFNSSQGACSEETRTARTAFEPGSGSSIMSYAGYCGLDNLQSHTDAMYHIGSIKQIAEYTKSGIGSRCGVVKLSENTPPIVNAGNNFTIPARTPFELVGSAEDNDGDSLLYAWEQLDAGDSSTESADKGNNALFRVHSPNSSKSRSFPPLENVLNHVPVKGETLPNYQRGLNISFVAQDGFNVAQSDEMTINVVRTGSRFALNYPRAHYTRGSTYSIFWNVANTIRAPINCSSVNIWLSIDGGKNFNYPVAENVPNTGEVSVTVPADATVSNQGRFKIKCSDNIFFAISHRNFYVTQYDDSITLEYNNEDEPETDLKDRSLNSDPIVSSSEVNSNTSGGGLFGIINILFAMFLGRSMTRLRIKK